MAEDRKRRGSPQRADDHMCRATMSQHMRSYIAADTRRGCTYYLPQPLPGELLSTPPHENIRRILSKKVALRQIMFQRISGGIPKPRNAFLVAFPPH